ncbi:MAG: hypothetical protein WC673_00225 [Candidatus Paceibacterota bacterium]
MKNLAAVLILVSFISMAVFGAIIINDSMMNHNGCIASAVTGGDCPINQLALFFHHLAPLQVFSISLPLAPVALLFLFLLLCVFAVSLAFGKIYYLPASFSLAYIKSNRSRGHFHKHSLLRWLALFENSPSL